MSDIYPLKLKASFNTADKTGIKISKLYNNKSHYFNKLTLVSGVEEESSMVENGYLAENTLDELIEVYMGDLVGDKVYEKFGNEFPLSISLNETTSKSDLLVHPNDKYAKEKHKAYGKEKFIHFIDTEGAEGIDIGFNQELTRDMMSNSLKNKNLSSVLNHEQIEDGDSYYIPAGRVYSIGASALYLDIQQNSDIDYHLYDFVAESQNSEDLKYAMDIIDFSFEKKYKSSSYAKPEQTVELARCDSFTTNVLEISSEMEIDLRDLDSFSIYICIEGRAHLFNENCDAIELKAGDTVLVPASNNNVIIKPVEKSKFIEVFSEQLN
ncbi:MAG: hypothetical protein N4A49_13250 [Marinifilaceae bacterium]|jgi:mannose-6-phosphate isomerase|nr:hypothetical protein [Marinifilaceae bacterium]